MSDEPASLLTKTQRRRLAEEFAGVDDAKRRRDQRQIRQRVAAGLADFRYLVDYPDEQFELALDDVDDDELERVLADVLVVAERLRLLHGVDRESVARTAGERADAADAAGGTLARVEFPTDAGASRDAGTDASGSSAWKRRSDQLLKVGLLFFTPAWLFALVAPDAANGPVGGIPALFGGIALVAGLAIVAVRGLKYDVAPAVAALVDDPIGAFRSAWSRI